MSSVAALVAPSAVAAVAAEPATPAGFAGLIAALLPPAATSTAAAQSAGGLTTTVPLQAPDDPETAAPPELAAEPEPAAGLRPRRVPVTAGDEGAGAEDPVVLACAIVQPHLVPIDPVPSPTAASDRTPTPSVADGPGMPAYRPPAAALTALRAPPLAAVLPAPLPRAPAVAANAQADATARPPQTAPAVARLPSLPAAATVASLLPIPVTDARAPAVPPAVEAPRQPVEAVIAAPATPERPAALLLPPPAGSIPAAPLPMPASATAPPGPAQPARREVSRAPARSIGGDALVAPVPGVPAGTAAPPAAILLDTAASSRASALPDRPAALPEAAPAPATRVADTPQGGIALATERLGAVHVMLDAHAARVAVQFSAETASAGQLLAAHPARLADAMTASGQRLEALSVDVRGGDGGQAGRQPQPPPSPSPRTAAPPPGQRPPAAVRAARADRFA